MGQVLKENLSEGCQIAGDVPSLGCLSQVVVNVVNVLFTFLGAAALLYLLFGAIKFVTSRGDQKALQSARGTMTYAMIGLIVILLSYTLINFVTKSLGLPSVLDNFTFYQ